MLIYAPYRSVSQVGGVSRLFPVQTNDVSRGKAYNTCRNPGPGAVHTDNQRPHGNTWGRRGGGEMGELSMNFVGFSVPLCLWLFTIGLIRDNDPGFSALRHTKWLDLAVWTCFKRAVVEGIMTAFDQLKQLS